MPESSTSLTSFLDNVPPSDEVRRQIAENAQQAKLLRQVLRLSEQRERTEAACTSPLGGRNARTRPATTPHQGRT